MESTRVGVEARRCARRREPGRRREQDDILVVERRHAEGNRPGRIGLEGQCPLGPVVDAPVAALAVEECELREGPVAGQRRFGEQAGDPRRGLGLPHGPEAHRPGRALAGQIVRILVPVLLESREEIELEIDARMPGRHDPVGDELSGLVAAEMAVEADIGAHGRPFEREHPCPDIVGMSRADSGMARQPA